MCPENSTEVEQQAEQGQEQESTPIPFVIRIALRNQEELGQSFWS